MDKLIVITTPYFFSDEASLIGLLFAEGMPRLHLRKPGCGREELEALLDKISPEYYERIVLHDWFSLAGERGLGGVHLNRRNPELPLPQRQRKPLVPSAGGGGTTQAGLRLPLPEPDLPKHLQGRIRQRVLPGRIAERAGYHRRQGDRLGRNLPAYDNETKRDPFRRCRRTGGSLGERSLPTGSGSHHRTIQKNTDTDMALNDSFGRDNRLMLITHRTERYTELDEIRMALEGGCSWVQLRMKEGMDRETARAAKELCDNEKGRPVVFCVNDHVGIALECGATACHLGKKDTPVDVAWEMAQDRLAPDRPFYIGATANTFEDIRLAVARGASYIGLGPYRFTGTKRT